MPVFVWKGRRGTTVLDGEIEAGSLEAARARLRAQRIIITSLKKKPKSVKLKIPGLGSKISSKEVIIFARQFSTMIDAGLPLVQCLDILAKQTSNKAFAEIIFRIKSDIESGETFADALRKHPKIFDQLFANMVEAGEAGGVLETILQRLAAYMEKAAGLKKQVKSALVYPASIMGIALMVVLFLLIWVIPTFAAMFAEFGATLPAPTRMVIRASDWAKAYLLYVLIGSILFGVTINRYYNTENGRRKIDGFLLRVPIFGSLVQKIAIAKFTRTLGTLLSSGVSIVESLGITARVAGNKIIEDAVLGVISSIKEGKTIASTLAKEKVFPPMVVQMIDVGEASGSLDTMLNKISDFYDEEVDTAVSALTSLLEPMLMVFLGVTLGFVIIAMYMPIFQLAGTIG
jgi:type IV pilus assembly protein PilC